MNDTALLEELKQLAALRIGLRITADAHERFISFFRERAAHLGYASLQDYRTFLSSMQTTGEWEYLARAFTTGETFFFRDHGQFDLIRLRLLPELIARHRVDKTLRLWSAGCASGEEVYSLAMLVDMLIPERNGWDILILGTDINSEALANARRGRYGQWSFRMTPLEIQQRYFHAESEMYNAGFFARHSTHSNPHLFVLDERILHMVTLRISNLVAEPFPDSTSELHDMDLIMCRNVFIYFDPAAVFAVATKFAATLREGGYLMTAHTELMSHKVQELESMLLAEGVVYQRRFKEPPPAIRSIQVRENHLAPRHSPALRAMKKPSVPQAVKNKPSDALLKEAHALADRGDFAQAEQVCQKVLALNPLAAAPYFLLSQLAQVKKDLDHAKDCLNKAIYLDHHFVAAYLELALVYEHAKDLPRAQVLRRTALDIVRVMPADTTIEQYETTAGDLVQWLMQWEHEQTESPPKK